MDYEALNFDFNEAKNFSPDTNSVEVAKKAWNHILNPIGVDTFLEEIQSKKVITVADALESDSTRELSTNVGEPHIMVSWPNARSNENDTVAITQPMDRCESESFNIWNSSSGKALLERKHST